MSHGSDRTTPPEVHLLRPPRADTAHRRALAGHLNRLVSIDIEQAFIIAHSRDVLESLPGRIEVLGEGDWSTVRVVA